MFDSLVIGSPKRAHHSQVGWECFFPYYAGFPETFARPILESARLSKKALVFDPWNGSGTTTFSAAQLGLKSCGFDLNPVMVVIARSRLLSASEADSLSPLARELVSGIRIGERMLDEGDPLAHWFSRPTAALIRAIEKRIRQHLIGELTLGSCGLNLERISSLAATFYVALLSVSRELTKPYRASNPTWLRKPRNYEPKIEATKTYIVDQFRARIQEMAAALNARPALFPQDGGPSEIRLSNTTINSLDPESVDFVLTSPPYCTRIDYTAATRIELAVLNPLVPCDSQDLSRQMIGSTRVPRHKIAVSEKWGPRCHAFLSALKNHSSKASSGYYYKTHLDYFDKISRSIANLAVSIKTGGAAIFVVQDSYYKDIHNDLPSIIEEIGAAEGLTLRRRDDFYSSRSMAGINPHSRTYKRTPGAVEAVLCFQKRSRTRAKVRK